MITNEDMILGQIAVGFDFISEQQLQQAIQIVQAYHKQKHNINLYQYLIQKQLLDKTQATIVQQKFIEQKSKKKFGRYEIIEEIGKGGMGRVYKVYDPQLDRIVALKVLLDKEDQENMTRFLREAKATAKLKHPNIIPVYDIGYSQETPFFTMELIAGNSLKQLIHKSTFSILAIVKIMIKVCKAVHFAHLKGVIHRDLKPANVMLVNKKEPIVMDFGLAKIYDESIQISKSGVVLGTLLYMPPEQADGRIHEVDVRSDIYSLGAIFYECLTQKTPFSGGSFFDIIEKIVSKNPTPPTQIKKRIPKNLEIICLKALAKEKNDRYQTAQEFAEDLERFSQGNPIRAHSNLPKKYKMTIVIFLVVIALFFVAIFNKKPLPKKTNSPQKQVQKKLDPAVKEFEKFLPSIKEFKKLSKQKKFTLTVWNKAAFTLLQISPIVFRTQIKSIKKHAYSLATLIARHLQFILKRNPNNFSQMRSKIDNLRNSPYVTTKLLKPIADKLTKTWEWQEKTKNFQPWLIMGNYSLEFNRKMIYKEISEIKWKSINKENIRESLEKYQAAYQKAIAKVEKFLAKDISKEKIASIVRDVAIYPLLLRRLSALVLHKNKLHAQKCWEKSLEKIYRWLTINKSKKAPKEFVIAQKGAVLFMCDILFPASNYSGKWANKIFNLHPQKKSLEEYLFSAAISNKITEHTMKKKPYVSNPYLWLSLWPLMLYARNQGGKMYSTVGAGHKRTFTTQGFSKKEVFTFEGSQWYLGHWICDGVVRFTSKPLLAIPTKELAKDLRQWHKASDQWLMKKSIPVYYPLIKNLIAKNQNPIGHMRTLNWRWCGYARANIILDNYITFYFNR